LTDREAHSIPLLLLQGGAFIEMKTTEEAKAVAAKEIKFGDQPLILQYK